MYSKGVYEPGRYSTGIGFEFIEFPSTLINFDLEGNKALSIFIEDGLESLVEVSWQCYLDETNLVNIHRSFQTDYDKIITSIGTQALKNVG